MKNRILSFLLALVMMMTMIPALDLHASASTAYNISGINGIVTVHWDEITSPKKDCVNYANYFYNKVWGHRANKYFADDENCLRNLSDQELLLTPENLKAFVTYARIGSVLRVCDAEYLHGGDGWGHSVFIVDKDENGFTMFEGGLNNYPHCREKYYTWDKFVEVKGYQYIKYIKWPSAEAYVPCVHKYTDVGVCTSTCKKPFDFMGTKDNLVAGTYKITLKGGVYPRTDRPYAASANKADLIPEGAEVTVEYSVKNHYGNRWFFVAYKGIKGYVSADNMVLVAHDCNHGKFKWKWTAHPHYNCYECSLCGEIVADTNEPTYNKSCQTCVDNHVHDKGQFKWSWTDHPHYNCYECKVCGEIVADTSEPTYKSSCGTCTETHKHDHGKFKWKWTAHPHYNCYECSGCGEIVADTNEPTFRADCQTCLESHEHDHGKFKWKWTAHPHYNCYECSLCGEIVADTNEPTFRTDCESCTNAEKPCQHRYDFTIIQEPTLTQGGTYTVECITCGEFTNCDLPMLNTKDYAYTRPVEASCENNGREEYRWTDDFGADFLFEVYSPATGHSAELQNTKTAACTTDGYTGDEICKTCGKTVKSGEVIKATGHKWDDGKVTKNAACEADGEKKFTCQNDSSHTKTETTPAVGHKDSNNDYKCDTCGKALCTEHSAETIKGYAATCTEAGLTDGAKCSKCGKVLTEQKEIPATGHISELKNAKSATCTVDGYTGDEICKTCGKTLKQGEIIKAAGHKWDDGKVTKNAACEADGEKKFTCQNDSSHTKTETIPAVGHKDGNNDYKCDTCGKSLCTDHSVETIKGYAATCTEAGLTDGTKCSKCGKILTEQKEIPAIGHSTEVKNAKAATCTSNGYTGDEICKTCGKTVKNGEVIKATGHKWDDGKVIKDAACEADGEKLFTCQNDISHTKTETIPAVGHKDGNNDYKCDTCGKSLCTDHSAETIKGYAATCTEAGLTDGAKCSKCGKILTEQKEIPALGHSTEVKNAKAATCTADGYTGDEICKTCGKTLKQGEVIKAAGHKWDSGKVTKDAACEADGEKKFTCQNDSSHTKTESISATGHKDSNNDYKCDTCGKALCTEHSAETIKGYAATCTEAGLTDGAKCSKCGKVLTEQKEIPATGHISELKNEKTATCTNDGYTGDEICKTCGKIIKSGEVIKATGHKWDNGKVTKEPTETTEGIKQFSCTVCKETKEESIPVTIHKHNFKDTVVAPSCTESGYTEHKCSCGESYKDNYTDALGHTPELKNTKDVSCTTDGYTGDEVCALCGKTVKTGEVIEAKGHSFSNGKCTVCGAADPNYKDPTPPPADNPFTDVKNGDWFYAPVLWAVENGVTGGTSPTTFSPNNPCTRAQVVTFLWAANGKPEPTSMNNPFTDVSDTAWYCKAVMWAVEKGITGGTSATTFSPDAYCTRAQVATFLYAAQGKPAVKNTSNEFVDVPDGAWYMNPVLWAKENDITGGIGGGKFGPDQTCTRAQIATFLYKAMS